MDASTFLLIRGLVAVVIGILAMAWPGITMAAIVGIFGLYAVIDGITSLMLGLTRTRTHGRSWAVVVQGVIGILAGIVTFVWPGITAFALVMFIGAWGIVTGVFEIVAAIRLRRVIKGEWLLALSGIISVLFGFLVFAFPAAGAVGIAWVLGIYAVTAGLVLIALGVRLRSPSLVHSLVRPRDVFIEMDVGYCPRFCLRRGQRALCRPQLRAWAGYWPTPTGEATFSKRAWKTSGPRDRVRSPDTTRHPHAVGRGSGRIFHPKPAS
jgi:uncharacterized membrane protein HdeD (DUF308 family)